MAAPARGGRLLDRPRRPASQADDKRHSWRENVWPGPKCDMVRLDAVANASPIPGRREIGLESTVPGR
jgi:hypothetical protein